MSLYFGTTEITNIDNLVPQTGLDITDIWFGSTNVYTVWKTYEGTLPATLNANGADMRQYQIYGNVSGVGDRTDNLFDMSFYKGISGITVSGAKVTGTCDRFFNVRLSIPAELYGQELTWSVYIKRPDSPNTARVQTIDGGTYKYGNDITGEGRSTVRFTATSTIRLYINYGGTGADTIELTDIMLTEGSTPPASYEPYGYKLDMSVSDGTTSTTTSIYIGDDPLGEDEYADYGEQKIYRMIDGTLTPTDPPVPLPALPTVEGETVVDYAGQSVAPEKVLLKYRKEEF